MNANLNSVPLIFVVVRVIKPRRMKLAGHTARMGERRNAYKILFGKPEGRRPLGRRRYRWEDNIKVGVCGLYSSGSG
jgi:hypothetical protein